MRILIDVMISGVLLWISYKDMREQKITNKSIIVFGMLTIVKLWLSCWKNMGEHMVGALIVSVPMLLITMYRPGAFGGGDLKLMVVAGLYLGKENIILATELAIALAAAYSLWLLIGRKKSQKTTFPLGPFLCMGIEICMINCIYMKM